MRKRDGRQRCHRATFCESRTLAMSQISPNGEWVIYTVSTVEGNTTVSTLWLSHVGATTSTVQQAATTAWPNERSTPVLLLASDWTGSNPRWSPDSSKIAFLGDHNAHRGIWVVSLDNRQPRFIAAVQNTNFFITYAGESLAWSPDSKRIAYISATEEITEVPDSSTTRDDPRVIDRIQYKSRTSFSDKRRTHVWITAVDKPEPRQLTSGYFTIMRSRLVRAEMKSLFSPITNPIRTRITIPTSSR